MSMKDIGIRLAALCGVLYPVALIVGDDVIGRGDRIAPDSGTPDEVAARVADFSTPAYLYGRALGLVAVLCLVVFAAYVGSRALRVRGPHSMLPWLCLGSGVLAAALLMSAAAPQLSAVKHGGGGSDPEALMMFLDLGVTFVLSMLPLGGFVGALAIASWDGQIVGRAVARVGAVLSIALLVGFVLTAGGVDAAFIPLPLSWLWFIAAGVSAMRRVNRVPEYVVGDEPDGRDDPQFRVHEQGVATNP